MGFGLGFPAQKPGCRKHAWGMAGQRDPRGSFGRGWPRLSVAPGLLWRWRSQLGERPSARGHSGPLAIGPALGHRPLGHWATEPRLWGHPFSTKAGAGEHAEEVSGKLGLGPGGVGLAPRWSNVVESVAGDAADSGTLGSGWTPSGSTCRPGRLEPPGAARRALRRRRGRAEALPRGHFDPAVALLRVLGHVRRCHRLLLNRVLLGLELVHERLHLARRHRSVASAGAPRSTHLVAKCVQLR